MSVQVGYNLFFILLVLFRQSYVIYTVKWSRKAETKRAELLAAGQANKDIVTVCPTLGAKSGINFCIHGTQPRDCMGQINNWFLTPNQPWRSGRMSGTALTSTGTEIRTKASKKRSRACVRACVRDCVCVCACVRAPVPFSIYFMNIP